METRNNKRNKKLEKSFMIMILLYKVFASILAKGLTEELKINEIIYLTIKQNFEGAEGC